MPYVLFGLLLALLPRSGTAAELRLDGGWRTADAREQAAAVARDDPRLQHFDPAQLQVFRGGDHGSWVLLWPARESWPPAPWVLEVMSPGLQTLSLYASASEPPRRARLNAPATDAWAAHGRIAFPVEVAPVDGEPLRLHVDASGVIPSTMSFSVLPVVEHLRADARWLAFASACLAVMAAMAVIALFFALRLLDPTFVYYAIFVLAYAVILALQTGYASDPLGWHALAESPRGWGRFATTLSVVFAILFLDRFADLRRHAPRMRRVLLGYAAVIAAFSVLGQLPMADADALARAMINPLLILGGPLLLGAAALAAWRGARYANFFLLGWTPLLLVTVCGSLQLYGFMPAWTWSADAAFGAGALEALVLSLGLAERSLALRRDRDQARRLADIDALTGLYNRRAWSDRLLELKAEAQREHQPLSVLFLDLDRFKDLNDRFGHEAGDAALRTLAGIMREELREQDMIGRYGGEEFVVALPGADHQHALHVAERIRQRLHDDAASDPMRAAQTVSVGVAMLDDHEDTATLLQRADAAMYAAKAAGRNRVVLADS